MSFQQAPHKLLLIPGPIEVSDPGRSILLQGSWEGGEGRRYFSALGWPSSQLPGLQYAPVLTFRTATVLLANAHPSMSHVSPVFAPVFASALKRLRKVLYTETAQPFIIAGSGTLGW